MGVLMIGFCEGVWLGGAAEKVRERGNGIGAHGAFLEDFCDYGSWSAVLEHDMAVDLVC